MKTNTAIIALLLFAHFCGYSQHSETLMAASNTEEIAVSENSANVTSPVPLKMLASTNISAMNINAKKGMNRLIWQANAEKKCRYIIQRSIDNQNFEDICFISKGEPTGNSVAFQFDDESPMEGINYYRIKKVKKKKEIFYSQVMSVNTELLSPFGKISNFDMPFYAKKLQLDNIGNIEDYGLYSQSGIQIDGVLAKNKLGYTFDFKEKPSAGLYVLLTKTETQTHTYRVIID